MGQGLLKKLLVGIQPPWGLTALGLRPDHDYVGSPKRHPHCIAGEVVPDWNCGEAIRGAGSEDGGRVEGVWVTASKESPKRAVINGDLAVGVGKGRPSSACAIPLSPTDQLAQRGEGDTVPALAAQRSTAVGVPVRTSRLCSRGGVSDYGRNTPGIEPSGSPA